MNKTEATELLKTNIAVWNKYRDDYPEWRPDLWGADFLYADLRGANLREADLPYANLRYADLRGADLRYANLRYANLREADLRYANLENAKLTRSQAQPWIGEPDWQDEA